MGYGCIGLAEYLTGIGTGFLAGVALTITGLLVGFAFAKPRTTTHSNTKRER